MKAESSSDESESDDDESSETEQDRKIGRITDEKSDIESGEQTSSEYAMLLPTLDVDAGIVPLASLINEDLNADDDDDFDNDYEDEDLDDEEIRRMEDEETEVVQLNTPIVSVKISSNANNQTGVAIQINDSCTSYIIA